MNLFQNELPARRVKKPVSRARTNHRLRGNAPLQTGLLAFQAVFVQNILQ